MTSVVVLGANGFIGRNIVAALGPRAVPMASSDVNLLDARDVRDKLAPHVGGASLIFSAGLHRQRADDMDTLFNNMRMIENMTGAMSAAPPKSCVFLSSVEVYGAPEQLPVTEATPIKPQNLYAIGKIACELMFQRHCRQADIPLACVRLPGVYGRDDRGTSIVGRMVGAATGGAAFTLMGAGVTRRDYIHVSDVAAAAIRLTDECVDGTLNLASGETRTLNELIALVSDRFGPCRIEHAPAAKNDFDLSFDLRAMNALLPGFTPMAVERGIHLYADARP